MPSPGRRRPKSLVTFVFLFTVFAFTASAASAVLGIDLGTEYIKAALVKPGIPLEIVLTKDSKRKETAAVAFKPLRARANTAESDSFPERVYGGDAVALSARFPNDVYPNLKPLLGLRLSDDIALEYGGIHSGLELVEYPETGTIGFQSGCFVGEEEPWLIEELLAMELKNIKGNAETMAGKGSAISDVVITVPSFYNVEERRAVTLAADLAGLRVLSLISDGLSVGLNYATSRTFPTVNEGGKPEIHLIYDMGAASTTATVLKFQGRVVKDVGKYNKTIQEVQVLGTSWDKSLGGDALNRLILDDMIKKITTSGHMKPLGLQSKHVKSHGRTMAKLWKEAERIRQVLSANTETSTIMEGLYYEDFTFKYKLSRADFEKLASIYSDRVQTPVEEALELAKLTSGDLESVVLHGGTVRTPFVQKQLEAVIQDSEKIRTNVNSDEAAVFGAAFKAAAVNPSFRVKEIRTADSAVYPVSISWSIDGKDKRQKIFLPTSLVGAEKQISVKITEDLSFSLSQQVSEHELPVSVVKTQNLTVSVQALMDKGCAPSDISTKFAIRLSPVDSLPEVTSGTVSCEVTEAETKKGGVVEGVKDLFGFGSKKGDQEPLKEENDAESSASASESEISITSSSADGKATDTNIEESVKEEKPKEAKTKVETIYVGFTTEAGGKLGVKSDTLQRMKKRLTAFDKSDRSRIIREETLNSLEGYTYKIRDILEDEDFISASTENQRDEIETKSNDASLWLYGDGAEASREALKERLDELRGLVQPVQKRKEEAKQRPSEVQKLKDAIQQADTMINVFKLQNDVEVMSAETSPQAEAETSTISQTTIAPSPSTDDFADLDDEPSTSTFTKTVASKMPAPVFSEDDIEAIVKQRDDVQKWLDEKLEEQDKLSMVDDPVIYSADISAKSQEINDAVMNLLTKQMKAPNKSSKKAKVPKAKKTTYTTATATDSSTIESGEPPKGTTGPSGGLDIEVEDMANTQKVTQEEIDEAIAEQKSKAEKTKKSAKPKATTKAKSKGKGKTKGKDKERPEREL